MLLLCAVFDAALMQTQLIPHLEKVEAMTVTVTATERTTIAAALAIVATTKSKARLQQQQQRLKSFNPRPQQQQLPQPNDQTFTLLTVFLRFWVVALGEHMTKAKLSGVSTGFVCKFWTSMRAYTVLLSHASWLSLLLHPMHPHLHETLL